MRRLAVILASVAAAGGIAATPALAGIGGNPSSSQQIQVPGTSQADQPSLQADDHGGLSHHAEPGDDHGAAPEVEPGDDSAATPEVEPGDDHGGLVGPAEPGDDRGGRGGSSSGGR